MAKRIAYRFDCEYVGDRPLENLTEEKLQKAGLQVVTHRVPAKGYLTSVELSPDLILHVVFDEETTISHKDIDACSRDARIRAMEGL